MSQDPNSQLQRSGNSSPNQAQGNSNAAEEEKKDEINTNQVIA